MRHANSPMITCLQIGLSSGDQCPDLVNGLSVGDRGVPLVTVAYGTLKARRSWSSLLGCPAESIDSSQARGNGASAG